MCAGCGWQAGELGALGASGRRRCCCCCCCRRRRRCAVLRPQHTPGHGGAGDAAGRVLRRLLPSAGHGVQPGGSGRVCGGSGRCGAGGRGGGGCGARPAAGGLRACWPAADVAASPASGPRLPLSGSWSWCRRCGSCRPGWWTPSRGRGRCWRGWRSAAGATCLEPAPAPGRQLPARRSCAAASAAGRIVSTWWETGRSKRAVGHGQGGATWKRIADAWQIAAQACDVLVDTCDPAGERNWAGVTQYGQPVGRSEQIGGGEPG